MLKPHIEWFLISSPRDGVSISNELNLAKLADSRESISMLLIFSCKSSVRRLACNQSKASWFPLTPFLPDFLFSCLEGAGLWFPRTDAVASINLTKIGPADYKFFTPSKSFSENSSKEIYSLRSAISASVCSSSSTLASTSTSSSTGDSSLTLSSGSY